jgi:hypothetical protein
MLAIEIAIRQLRRLLLLVEVQEALTTVVEVEEVG